MLHSYVLEPFRRQKEAKNSVAYESLISPHNQQLLHWLQESHIRKKLIYLAAQHLTRRVQKEVKNGFTYTSMVCIGALDLISAWNTTSMEFLQFVLHIQIISSYNLEHID